MFPAFCYTEYYDAERHFIRNYPAPKKKENEWQVLLIQQYSKIGNNSYWVFPKGHPEGNETPLETARRELKEETGLEVGEVIKHPVFTIEYTFQFDGQKIDKTVGFFLGLILETKLDLNPEEVKDAKWLSLEEALNAVDYSDTKKMFAQVVEYLSNNPNLFTK